MSTTLDGIKLFDENPLRIEVGSYKRDTLEKSSPMLDGVISIDLGRRSRIIKQKGSLRVRSRTALNHRTISITNFQDGNSHTLITDSIQYQNLRMDSFKITDEKEDGAGLVAEYEIIYTQLA